MNRIITLILIMAGVFGPAGAAQAEGERRWIHIPALGISQAVVTVPYDGYQWDTSRLGDGIGHLEYLDWLDGGNTVLVGHNPGVFDSLDQLQVGDVLYLYDAADVYKFAVKEMFKVKETALWVYYSTQSQRLTLFTCWGQPDERGAYPDRLVVIAEPSP
ncbi:MAG: sortase [Anaerolineae bacterium]|nr:sortase [Anaerolineae bacterium]